MDRLSVRLMDATREVHERAENSEFVTELLAGRLPPAAYAAMLAQHYYVYATLERIAEPLRSDPVVGPFVIDDLARVPALEADLPWLLGPGWRADHPPTTGTSAYVAHITDACTAWPTAFVAHHYTRYIGDLFGGRVIKGLARRTYGYTDAGVRFYTFPTIAKPKRFRDEYRGLLDTLDLTPEETDRLTDEAVTAFRHNITVFAELAARIPAFRAA